LYYLVVVNYSTKCITGREVTHTMYLVTYMYISTITHHSYVYE